MKENKRIFVAAWEYPPLVSGESIVCRKTLEHSRFDYDVCCGPLEGNGGSHVRLFPTGGNKYLKWPFAALKQFRKLDRAEDYSVMMSRVMPANGHLAGWLIKRCKPTLKWVVYFSDPVWNSPFLKFGFRKDGSQRPNWLLMKVFGIPAKLAVREADLLVFNNQRLAQYVLGERYNNYKNKVVIAPYGHEGVYPRPVQKRGDGKMRLTHVGQIYGNRTLEALVSGAELLQRQDPALFARLDIRQVGFICDIERRRVERSPAASAFTLVGQVLYEVSIEEMYAADCLLAIDPVFDDARKNIYIPGKLFDYMSTGRPIICIADEDSATGDVAKIIGCPIIFSSGGSGYGMLKTLLTDSVLLPQDIAYERFHCQVGTDDLDNAIQGISVAYE